MTKPPEFEIVIKGAERGTDAYIAEIFSALSNLYRSHGGIGFTFRLAEYGVDDDGETICTVYARPIQPGEQIGVP